MAYLKYVVLVSLSLGVLGDEKALCTKKIRTSQGSEVSYREELGCCAGYTEVTGDQLCRKCPIWTYGLSCRHKCRCDRKNTKYCDHITGSCECRREWTGQTCAIQSHIFKVKRQTNTTSCPSFFYGPDCALNCTCRVGTSSSCDPVTGECTCLSGYTGSNCEQTCSQFTYGQNCAQNCSCDVNNTVECNAFSGACSCKYGWEGIICDEICSNWTYSKYCDKSCECNQTNTEVCHHVTGECTCNPGYQGQACNEVCPAYFYGTKCQSECACDRNLSTSCDHVTGECNCITGYDRPHCNTTCPNGFYGDLCSSQCDCPSTAYGLCNHITGACTCKPGYVGDACQTECPDNSYGVNCLGICDCLTAHTSYCDKRTGSCVCTSGWEGTRCDTVVASISESLLTSPVIVGAIAVAATLLLLLIILFILWKICRCSCTEVRHRAHKDKGAVLLMNSPITPGSNNAAISAMATTTTQLKHDGIYYYNADLKKATEAVEDNPDHSQNSKDIDTYYYGGIQGAPPPANAPNTPSKRTINETYYDDGDVGGVVEPGINDAEKGKTSSATSSYQNVSSPAKTTNAPVQKVNRPALPALPRFGSDLNKPTERIYRNETVETPFGSKPTYGNTGRKLPGLEVNDKYESLDSNTRDTSSEYAELK